ncbi:MAG: PolC-type DNA polymerase III [Lactobacillales bacterium]|jgi:DNA polymerase-3 subunit alpha (Gram-positive type)|nr:PolC-type DNA polymerase III [Lactobacillales bacterium]
MNEQRDLFEKLMSQIRLTPEDKNHPFIKQGTIKKVQVYPAKKIWAFDLEFPEILPVQLYRNLLNHLHGAFQSIADVRLKISAQDDSYNDQALADYWQVALHNQRCDSPAIQRTLMKNSPVVKDGKVILPLENEAMIPFLQQKYMSIFEAIYQQYGFPKFKIEPKVDKKLAEAAMKAFEDKKQEDAERISQLASEQLIANEQRKQEKVKTSEDLPEVTGPVQLGREIPNSEEITAMKDIVEEERRVVFEGMIFDKEIIETRAGRKILNIKMTDYTSSFLVKKFSKNKTEEAMFEAINKGSWVRVRGSVQQDDFAHDLTMNMQDLVEIKHAERKDYAPEGEKRVELHVHTNMSTMDAVNGAADYVAQAGKWGHKAIAITDHAGAQAFPEAHGAGKKAGVKIIYGVEANIVDDSVPITYNETHDNLLDSNYVVFDVETTGLSAVYNNLIQIAATKMHKGNVIDEFDEFLNPGHPLSSFTTNLTGITDDMVRGSKPLDEVLKAFKEFCKGSILVAHNATFDIGFMNANYARCGLEEITEPCIDTLEFARNLYPDMKKFGLGQLTKKFGVNLESHHMANYDAQATAHLNWIFVKEANEKFGVLYHDELNSKVSTDDAYKRARPFHATIYAKDQAGLKNLFKLVSLSNVKYFHQVPRIPRSELINLREGIIVGSACDEGEVFEAMMQKGYEVAKEVAEFYDFIEVMPKAVYRPLIFNETVADEKELEDIVRQLVQVGKDLGKPVVATGNVHYLNREDAVYREILVRSLGWAMPLNRPKMKDGPLVPMPEVHFRTTDEMLDEFKYLGEDVAKEIVVTNTNLVADWFEMITPVRDDLYTPKIEGSEEQIAELTYNKARELYGDDLPEIVEKRIERELRSIIGNGFSVIYLIAQKLVHKSNADGYLVGSRGSVGSSFVATMTGITEVNPLPPHYYCPKCHYSEFYNDGTYGSGYDMPEKDCPECGTRLKKDGHDIPFETFLGFHGDKVPDIDLNFSGEYQPQAHNYTKVLFGEDYAYRAGTIGTVADKTAYGFVKAYERDNNLHLRNADIDRLSKGATGVKRTTGQHPGGIIVIPDYMDVYDFTPIQYPADDVNADWKTTHFDFHSIHDNILKLDILGHDDPTVIRMLQDLSGINPQTIPADDPEVMKIFAGPEVLGVDTEQIFSKTGTLGIPEFGTSFVRGMLEETHPSTFAELLQISGLSHGTDVWLGNAADLIEAGVTDLAHVIGCRDDIMVYLMHAGLDSGLAFKIMESVRKGKGIPDEWQEEMKANNVPDWYIDSCLKIKYMFPKAHAAAYVLMALRVAYFKVHFPILYYCAFFSIRADDFDLIAMAQGKEAVKARMAEIKAKGLEASNKEKNLMTVLELCNEMLERGLHFSKLDLYKSDAKNFVIDGDTLIPPFRAVDGLGGNVAKSIVEARKDGEFLSKEDLRSRASVSKTLIEKLDDMGALDELPDENQLSLFDDLF